MSREAGPLIIEGEVCADSDSNCAWEVYSDGCSDETLREDATVTKVDQDGGEVCTVGYDDAPGYVQKCIDRMIEREIERADREQREAARDIEADWRFDCQRDERLERKLAMADRERKREKGE